MTLTNPTALEQALEKVANTIAEPLDTAGITIEGKDNSGPFTEDVTWSKYTMTVDGLAITLTIAAAE